MNEFVLAKDAMNNIPGHLKDDLLERMRYMLGGICGDMQEREYAYVKRCVITGIELSGDQSKMLDKYYSRTYNKMSDKVLECANNEQADWRKLAKIFYNSEKYFRKQLTDKQLIDYQKNLPLWENLPLYMTDEIYSFYKSIKYSP
jgi:hypothetical protein